MQLAVIGLPKSGKTTVFNALTRGNAEVAAYASGSLEPNIGVVKVPDPRLDDLNGMFQPKKVTPADVTYVDIGGTGKAFGHGEGLGGPFLNYLTRCDALVHVVRAFRDERVPHPEGSVDPERDIATMNLELAFADLGLLEKRLQRIEIGLKGAKAHERGVFTSEQGLLARIKTLLEADIPAREQNLSEDEARLIENYQFFTAKPLLILANVGEKELPDMPALIERLRSTHARPHVEVEGLCGKLEMELGQLSEEEAQEFRSDMGLGEPSLDRVIRASYGLLGLISFFTVGPDEVRAWTIRRDATAVKAAGKIHSDMERGFIRAEVVSFADLVRLGNMAEARKHGALRAEGKTYEVKDGDILTILFNV